MTNEDKAKNRPALLRALFLCVEIDLREKKDLKGSHKIPKKTIHSFELEIIEVRPPWTFANFCIWIGGIQIGFYEDPVILSVIEAGLCNRFGTMSFENFENVDPEFFYNSLFENDEDGDRSVKDSFGKNHMMLGESFDDFSMFGFRQNECIHFFWILRDNPHFQYPDHPKGVQHKVVNYQYFCDVVNDKELWKNLQ